MMLSNIFCLEVYIFAKNNKAGLKSDYYVPNIDTYEAILNNLKNAKTENKVVGVVWIKKNHNCMWSVQEETELSF
jgi:hypothetical protein